MKDDNNSGHDFKRKTKEKNKGNVLKNISKTKDNVNDDDTEKKTNKLSKVIISFFTKLSSKFDSLINLDDENNNEYKVINRNENVNNNIDEKFIKSLNLEFNDHNNLKNDKKSFNRNEKRDKSKYSGNINDSPLNNVSFDNKRDKIDENDHSLVFLKNLKKINKFSENKNKDNLFHNDNSKQFLLGKDYVIKNKKDDESFESNSDETILNEKKLNLRDLFKINEKDFNKIKNKIFSDEETKTLIGAAIFGLILIVLVSSSYYFFFYQPFQDELTTAKIAKLNELNSIYKGPLAIDNEAFILKSQIENAGSIEEIKTIDIIRPATESWRFYHNKEINIEKDDFNRVMATYTSNKTKNIILSVDSAHKMVADNDATVLANIEFKRPDTVVVPILISRLQAGAGLISIGSVIDIYTLKSDNNYNQQNSSYSGNGDGEEANTSNSSNENLSNNENNKGSSISDGPDVSGATVLAIMRSKDSGSIDASYVKTQITSNGNITNEIENSNSFSSDIEQMLRAAISGGFDEQSTVQLLDKYGLKLSDYERRSNLAELEVQYLLLIEVPRDDVPFIINNMDNLILTIPTEHAPNWMINELKSIYT